MPESSPGWWPRHGRGVLLLAVALALIVNYQLIDPLQQRYGGDTFAILPLFFLVWIETGIILLIQLYLYAYLADFKAPLKIACVLLLIPQVFLLAGVAFALLQGEDATDEWHVVHGLPTLVLVSLEAWLIFGRFDPSLERQNYLEDQPPRSRSGP